MQRMRSTGVGVRARWPAYCEQRAVRLTTYTDYALRLLVYLATHRDRPCAVSDVARGYGISRNHLMKVVGALSVAGFVETLRGKGGGIRLARSPHLISLGEVVRATERDFTLVGCFDPAGPGCRIESACRLSGVLREALDRFFDVLDGYTLADLMVRRAALRNLLVAPLVRAGSN